MRHLLPTALLGQEMLTPLNSHDLNLIHELQRRLGTGSDITPEYWHELRDVQRHLARVLGVATGDATLSEPLSLIHDASTPTSLVGPRWWFHLLGLRHGAVHVVLTTPQGWFVAQRRSQTKDEAPGKLDVAVSGHMGLADSYEAAWREAGEELGLQRRPPDVDPDVVGNALDFAFTYDIDDPGLATENPPFVNRERRWVYRAALTASGLSRMRFADDEVTSLVFVGPTDLQGLVRRCESREAETPGEFGLALGIMDTLPRSFHGG